MSHAVHCEREQNQIADVMGKEVAEKLLQPEELANDLCAMAGEIIKNPNLVSSFRSGVQQAVAAHDQEIAAFLAPKIETALVTEIDRLVTIDKVAEFWTVHTPCGGKDFGAERFCVLRRRGRILLFAFDRLNMV